MFGVLGWIIFGVIVGAVAKLLMPGRDPGGFIVTMNGIAEPGVEAEDEIVGQIDPRPGHDAAVLVGGIRRHDIFAVHVVMGRVAVGDEGRRFRQVAAIGVDGIAIGEGAVDLVDADLVETRRGAGAAGESEPRVRRAAKVVCRDVSGERRDSRARTRSLPR